MFVSDVDLALVRHFFLHDEEGVFCQHFLLGSQSRQASEPEDGDGGDSLTPGGQSTVLQTWEKN